VNKRSNQNTDKTVLKGYSYLVWNWLDQRFNLKPLIEFGKHKEVPLSGHTIIWYYFGGVTLFFFLVQIITGIFLLMYYQAGESSSYESMKYLVGKVPFGWLIRSIHCWSAHFMCISLLIHMFSVYFTKAYRPPRELTWYTGMALIGLTFGFGFSGYLLPWNELSYFATAVGTDSVKAVPVIGDWLLQVMRGGPEVSIKTLYRFFALHVTILPLITFAVMGLHMIFIQRQGMAEPMVHTDDKPDRKQLGMPFFPNFVLRDLLLWVLLVNLLALVSVWLPYGPGIPGMEWELGLKADPLKPAYPGIKPEWYFLWVYQLLKEFPAHLFGFEGPEVCLFIVSIMMVIWFFIPFLDRRVARGKNSPGFTDFGVAAIYFLTFLTLKSWDIGVEVPHGVDPAADPAKLAIITRTSAILTIILGGCVSAIRFALFKNKYFIISGIALLHVFLHAFAGMSYLTSGGISLILVLIAVGFTQMKGEK